MEDINKFYCGLCLSNSKGTLAFSEAKNTLRIQNPQKCELIKINTDCKNHKQNNKKHLCKALQNISGQACDYLVIDNDNSIEIYIELKGSNIVDGLRQIINIYQYFHDANKMAFAMIKVSGDYEIQELERTAEYRLLKKKRVKDIIVTRNEQWIYNPKDERKLYK